MSITEFQEQCVQDDVRLAKYAVELARTVGADNVGEAREAHDVAADPSLDHRDDVEQLMGTKGVAFVTKILDNNEAILTESGRRESFKEYFILRERESAAARASLSLPTRPLSEVCNGKMCCLMSTCPFGAMLHDLWSPVASTAEARIVPARAAAYGRVSESIDLIAAYPQVMLGGDIKHYMIIPECVRRVMPQEEKAMFDKLRRPACECRGAVFGFERSGRDFIMSFAFWLTMNR